ncbi:hypothetical protein TcWFU_000608 [Taenia crassiceps]|uniref:Uncharacterized protein n=1 Tax=Taenia crassiceps TaxID=6207 RepID=A0ABR4QCF9_9CEST
MESGGLSGVDSVEVCETSGESFETHDESEGTEEANTPSVGKLQHDINMLSIKVLEKDMEIKGLRAESAVAKSMKCVKDFEMDKMKVLHAAKGVETQTEDAFLSMNGDASFGNQLFLVKQSGGDLIKQSSVLLEKLEALERANKILKEELARSKNECSAALARAIAAEKIQQALQGELGVSQNSRGKELPVGRLEQLHKSESCLEGEKVEVLNELSHLRREQDELHQRLQSAEVETRRFWDQMLRLYNKPDHEVRPISEKPDVLTKARVVSLEVQLNAACAARIDALREVERLTGKFEAASKAIYEMDAARKAEVSQMETQLAVASCKLAAYEQVEAELDRAIENFTSAGMLEKGEGSGALFHLANLSKGDDMPLLPTLASRRLEHCIKISRQLAESEEARRSLEIENRTLRMNLKTAENEVKRLSELLANVDKPTNCLASALVARDSHINDLQITKRKLENKLRRLYACTKAIVTERDAMISDLKVFFERSKQGTLEDTFADETSPPLTQLRRKVRRAQPLLSTHNHHLGSCAYLTWQRYLRCQFYPNS